MSFVCTRCKRDVDTPGLFCPFCGAPAPQPDAEPTDPFIGKTIAQKYFVNALLGRGGMGQVYKATHLTLDRPVALKMLSRSFESDPSMVQRFHREARAASKLNHPSCISVLDFGEAEDGTLFIVMEYLPGRSLAKVLSDDFPLGELRVVRIVGQILGALAEAHAAGIIHRDLKLSNVMVEARRDEPDFVKVLDFGIAKLTEAGAAGQLTGTGIVCGTPGYMSPEQARGEELDARSDLYAVGVILYELLSGQLPFVSDTPMGLVTKHLTEAPRSLRETRPDLRISPALDAIVMRVLSKAREERPGSAEELRELLYTCELLPDPAETRAGASGPATVVLSALPTTRTPRTPASPSGRAAPPAAGPTPSPTSRSQRAAEAAPGHDDVAPAPGRPERRPRGRVPAGRTPRIVAAALAALLVGFVGYLLLPGAPSGEAPKTAGAGSPAPSPGARLPELDRRSAAADPEPAPPPPAAPAPAPRAPPSPAPASRDSLEQRPILPSSAEPPARAPVAPAPQPRSAAAAAQKGAGPVEVVEGMNVLPVPAVASGQGILTVTADPWATVFLDGIEVGETPREARVVAGTYRVRLSHPTLGRRDAWVTVAAGRKRVYNASLKK